MQQSRTRHLPVRMLLERNPLVLPCQAEMCSLQTGTTYWLRQILTAIIAENRQLGVDGDLEVLVLHLDAGRYHPEVSFCNSGLISQLSYGCYRCHLYYDYAHGFYDIILHGQDVQPTPVSLSMEI